MSQFAAGCAVCGTDLQAARAELAERRAKRPQLPYDADRDGRVPTRNLMIVLLGFSLVGLVAYAQIWGGLFFGI